MHVVVVGLHTTSENTYVATSTSALCNSPWSSMGLRSMAGCSKSVATGDPTMQGYKMKRRSVASAAIVLKCGGLH
jgi:hypothetical protein